MLLHSRGRRGGEGGRGVTLDVPFPWFGGKRRVAGEVWRRFGDVRNYVEPFAGSLAVLLGRPHWNLDAGQWRDGDDAPFIRTEIANDLDGAITNFWRAVKAEPEKTAEWADNPVHELDLHARHQWLHRRLLSWEGVSPENRVRAERRGILPFAAWLEESPDHFDCQVAGWWCWGLSSWIGDNWCQPNFKTSRPHLFDYRFRRGRGTPVFGAAFRPCPLRWRPGNLVPIRRRPEPDERHPDARRGGDAGKGVNRQRPHLGDAGRGVNRQLPHLGDAGQGECQRHLETIMCWFGALSDRLRRVDICCGDWLRVLGNSPTVHRGTPCGVFLDPPYSQDHGLDTVYGEYHDADVAAKVRAWCVEREGDPGLRIALCGYDTEHAELTDRGWDCFNWKAGGGYSHTGKGSRGQANAHRERIWFSPQCLNGGPKDQAAPLFAAQEVHDGH